MTAAAPAKNEPVHIDEEETSKSENTTTQTNQRTQNATNKDNIGVVTATLGQLTDEHDEKNAAGHQVENTSIIEIVDRDDPKSRRDEQREMLDSAFTSAYNVFASVKVKQEKLDEAVDQQKEVANAELLWTAVDKATAAMTQPDTDQDEQSDAVSEKRKNDTGEAALVKRKKEERKTVEDVDMEDATDEARRPTDTGYNSGSNYYGALNEDDRSEPLQLIPTQVSLKSDKKKQGEDLAGKINLLKRAKAAKAALLSLEKNDDCEMEETETENNANESDDDSIDRTAKSYDGEWTNVQNRGKHQTSSGDDDMKETSGTVSALRKSGETKQQKKTSINSELPKHVSIGGRKVPKNNGNGKKLTSAEIAEKRNKEPEDITTKMFGEEKDDVKHVYRIKFELHSPKESSYADLIQTLFHRIEVHDSEVMIKPWYNDKPVNDITTDMTVPEQCWSKSRFNSYFSDVWSTKDRKARNNGSFTLYGKMRLETKLEYEELRGRMDSWIRRNKHYIKYPQVQAAKVVVLGIFLGSSTAQFREDVQMVIEKGVKQATGRFAKMEIQPKMHKYENVRTGEKTAVPVLNVQVELEKSDDAEDGLRKIFKKGVPSPTGRKMVFIPTRDRTPKGKRDLNMALTRQAEMNERERTMATSDLQNIMQEVEINDGQTLTIQQVLCGLQNEEGERIFTGAERLGKSGRVLFTCDVDMEDKAHEVKQDIVQVLSTIVKQKDHGKIADESKVASRETQVRQRSELSEYMEELRADWFNYGEDDTVSTLSSAGSTSSSVTMSNNWDPPARPKAAEATDTSASSRTTRNVWKDRQSSAAMSTKTADANNDKNDKAQIDMRSLREQLQGVTSSSKAAEIEMSKIQKEQAEVQETLRDMTGAITQQQSQLNQQQESLKEIKESQKSQLDMIKSILNCLNRENKNTTVATQSPRADRNLITQTQRDTASDGDSVGSAMSSTAANTGKNQAEAQKSLRKGGDL